MDSMEKPYLEGRTLHLKNNYAFGSSINFGEVTAREIGEVPIEPKKPKDFYPVLGMLTGLTPKQVNQLGREDILKAVEVTAGFLGE